ncbi:transglycosylase domain-containing protein [Allochromatium vinosum]|uniref:Glycosyl transferase family 51 n=1 Tax=Allochromatium vinosum (strain ATCC 17899 / DSM 180 / NBRC 103801 / NCIMB 10441 / D) TaxID=572477 RepID=D3RSX6_ALLVD|nr:glycosyl transferase family 51 [Allochromatium vinosum DSM 180]
MAAQPFLKCVIYALALPHIIISRVAELLKLESLEAERHRCLEIIDNHQFSIPIVFLDALITAEDHRNPLHPGIDPIGMIRAVIVFLHKGQIQGASTIEQQFVRVATGKVERTLLRKFREQLLALSLSRRRSKAAIASAYLSVAFFGSKCIGINGINRTFGSDLAKVKPEQALAFVSQLKYPRPLAPSPAWQAKISRRVRALTYPKLRAANKRLKATPNRFSNSIADLSVGATRFGRP